VNALVTGGRGRVGEAIVQRLERDGWSVFAAGRADGNVSLAAEARLLVERAARELGGLDLLVNCAGEGFAPKAFEELTEDDWDAAFGATAKGSFFVTQAAAPHLRASRGCVVMIEDVAGYRPWPSFAAHSAAKAAQAMLTRVLPRDRSRSSATRRRAAPRRRCSAASARPTTSPARSRISPEPASSPGRRCSWTAGAR
jgi:pteridine reductase